MDISSEVSYRFRRVSCWAMIAVVFIHAKFIMSRWSGIIDVKSVAGRVSDLVQFSISEVLCRLAVPLFFVISGFFMAYHNDGTVAVYKTRVCSRVKSLFIPYILFSLLWCAVTLVLGKVGNLGLWSLLRTILFQPVPFQFWFLQHLLLLVLCSWMLYFLTARWPKLLIALLLCAYIGHPDIRGAWWSSVLFYVIGMSMAIHSGRFSHRRIMMFAGLYAIAAAACIVMRYFQSDSGTFYLVLHKVAVLLGVYAVINWIFAGKARPVKMLISPRSCFWVFALHEPLQSMLKNIYLLFANSQLSILIGYLLIPFVTIAVCVAVSESMYRFMPSVARIMAGGR